MVSARIPLILWFLIVYVTLFYLIYICSTLYPSYNTNLIYVIFITSTIKMQPPSRYVSISRIIKLVLFGWRISNIITINIIVFLILSSSLISLCMLSKMAYWTGSDLDKRIKNLMITLLLGLAWFCLILIETKLSGPLKKYDEIFGCWWGLRSLCKVVK